MGEGCRGLFKGKRASIYAGMGGTYEKYVMALDQGTTSSRCILFDKAGHMKSVVQREFTQIYPKPGWVEHDPLEIWSSQLSVAVEAWEKSARD